MKKIFLLLTFTPGFALSLSKTINAVLIDPVFDRYYACAEHQAGQFKELGDALGTDCFIVKSENDSNDRKWLRSYKSNGHKNEDWFGWKQDVLSPIDGTVRKINNNGKINEPGITGEGTATFIIIESDGGLNIMLAHLTDLKSRLEIK